MDKVKETDLAWAAGFIDGEGCIGISSRNKKEMGGTGYLLRLTVGNTVREPLDRLYGLFGGRIHYQNRGTVRKGLWYWHISGKGVKEILKVLYPYLSVKRDGANIASLFPIGNKAKRHPLAVILQDECCKAMHLVNARGIQINNEYA